MSKRILPTRVDNDIVYHCAFTVSLCNLRDSKTYHRANTCTFIIHAELSVTASEETKETNIETSSTVTLVTLSYFATTRTFIDLT
jgi:hypothetical protein